MTQPRYSGNHLPPPSSRTLPPSQVYLKGKRGNVKTRSRSMGQIPTRSITRSRTREEREAVYPRGGHRSQSPAERRQMILKTSSSDHGSYQRGNSHRSQSPAERRQMILKASSSDHGSYQRPGSDHGSTRTILKTPSSDHGSYQLPGSDHGSFRTSIDVSTDETSKRSSRSLDRSPLPTGHEVTKHYIRQTRKIVEDLNRTQGFERRIAAITTACETFDHMDESMHNIELSQGAAQALAKQLSNTTNDDEVRMLSSALEMVCRASPASIYMAFDKLATTFPSILLRVMARCENGNVKNASIIILNIWRILLYLSRCVELRPQLGRQHGLFFALSRTSTRNSQPESRMARIRFIANLSNCKDNKEPMYANEGLFDGILRAAHFDDLPHVRHHAAVALTELASAEANQRSMAQNEKLMGTLVKMILLEQNEATREAVITAIQNLAFRKENRRLIVKFKSGIVLDALRKALLSDSKDPKARRRAAGAVTNLASDETSEIIGNHSGLLETLAIVATKDSSDDVQTRAALALTKLASAISVGMKCHEALLDALVVASLSKATNSVSAVLRVKAREQANREALARHPGIVDTLSDLCVSHVATIADRDNAVRALMHLVNEDKNRKILCNKKILEALTACAGFKDPDLVGARDSAIRAMERLATDFSNRPTMARHPNLLVVVAKAVEREAQWEEEGKKSDCGFLAKPLLMSLLVAM